jgi:uncharacterized protein YbcI/anti-sigma regulatory factor (Ser/Thr protein kinase)
LTGIRTFKLELELDRNAQSAAKARRALGAFADALAIDTYLDLRLIISELVTNSVLYGADEAVAVSVTVSGDGVITGRVTEGGRAGMEIGAVEAESETGLGLVIVDSLVAAWGIEPDTTTVWFELAARSDPDPPGEAIGRPSASAVEQEIAEEVMRLQLESFGTGAGGAEVLISEDAVVVFLDELELQRHESLLVEAGDGDTVIETRRAFQQALESTFRASIERIIGREVISFASVTKLDPNFACEIFRLAPRTALPR